MSDDIQIREQTIVRTSIIGIGANIVLVVFKAIIGLVTNSIALILDAVNNLSDVLSSVVTIAGAKFANKAPDKEHPYGHGRAEYLSQLLVAAIIFYAGVTAAVEAVKKIIEPEPVDHNYISLIVIGAAVAVKVILGLYVQRKGREVHSATLESSGKDALFDAVISVSVFISAVVCMISGFNMEAWVGVVISLFIIKSGFGMIKDAVDEMLGVRADCELTERLKQTISEEEEVKGVYDLILHNYGPERFLASAHIEVRDTITAAEIDVLTRQIQEKVLSKHRVVMTAIGIYSVNTSDNEALRLRAGIREAVMVKDGVIQFHGFYADLENKTINFDIIVDFEHDKYKLHDEIVKELTELYPGYRFRITLDADM